MKASFEEYPASTAILRIPSEPVAETICRPFEQHSASELVWRLTRRRPNHSVEVIAGQVCARGQPVPIEVVVVQAPRQLVHEGEECVR